MKTVVVDATDLILGRMATFVAKQLLNGNKVAVVNAEKAVISGTKRHVLEKRHEKASYGGGPLVGPFVPRRADMYVRRSIRGMLPYKKPTGAAAFKRLMCYIGVPAEFESQEKETVKGAHHNKLSKIGYVSIRDICRSLGGKV